MGSTSSKKPLIGVTGPAHGGVGNWLIMKFVILWNGGNACYLSSDLTKIPDNLDGIVISGGADIDPERYGKERETLPYEQTKKHYPWWAMIFYPIVKLYKVAFGIGSIDVDTERDALEWEVLDKVVRENLPLMGICRGMQLMNVYFGGSLHHNVNLLPNGTPYKKSVLAIRPVHIKKNTLLYNIWQTNECKINSLHNQGIDQLGAGLKVSARDENDLIQAIEHETHPFALGFQWHPEYMPHKPLQMDLFKAFIGKCTQFALEPSLKLQGETN